MAPSHFIELASGEQARLLGIARASIEQGIHTGKPAPTGRVDLEGSLGEPRGSFVTLRKEHALRGCVGSIEPLRPLAEAVSISAFNAAFRDRRFPKLEAVELELISIEISVLSPAVPLEIGSEKELLETLEPELDGLLLEAGWHRSTFLPKVWESLPEPAAFLSALKQKAGLPANYWSEEMTFYRYRSFSFSETEESRVAPA
jgi:AmmeMemoRadiSam system protein A